MRQTFYNFRLFLHLHHSKSELLFVIGTYPNDKHRSGLQTSDVTVVGSFKYMRSIMILFPIYSHAQLQKIAQTKRSCHIVTTLNIQTHSNFQKL